MAAIVLRNALVVTLDAQDRIHDPGEVWVEGGRIAYVGAPCAAPPPPGADAVDCAGRLVMPGLVNAHAHSYAALLHGTIPPVPLDVYMLHAIGGNLRRSPREIYVSALIDGMDMLRRGATSVLDHFSQRPHFTAEGLDAAFSAFRDLGLRATLAPMYSDRPLHETIPARIDMAAAPPAPEASPDRYFALCGNALRTWQGAEGRLRFLLGVDGPQRCTDALLERAGDFIRRHGTGNHMHLLESKTQAVMAPPGGFVAQLDRHGLANQRCSFAHFVWCSAADRERASARGVGVVHNGMSNLFLGNGIAPVRRLLQAGIPVALGSDGANCHHNGMFEKLRLASLLSRIAEPDHADWLSARDALRMATAHGARLLGYDGELGALATGARADLIVLPVVEAPRGDAEALFNHLAFFEDGNVEHAVVEGRWVLRDRRFAGIDEPAIRAEARGYAERLRQTLRAAGPAIATQTPGMAAMVRDVLARPWPEQRRADLR